VFYAVCSASNAANKHDAFAAVFEHFNFCFNHCLCHHRIQSMTQQTSHQPEQIEIIFMSDLLKGPACKVVRFMIEPPYKPQPLFHACLRISLTKKYKYPLSIVHTTTISTTIETRTANDFQTRSDQLG